MVSAFRFSVFAFIFQFFSSLSYWSIAHFWYQLLSFSFSSTWWRKKNNNWTGLPKSRGGQYIFFSCLISLSFHLIAPIRKCCSNIRGSARSADHTITEMIEISFVISIKTRAHIVTLDQTSGYKQFSFLVPVFMKVTFQVLPTLRKTTKAECQDSDIFHSYIWQLFPAFTNQNVRFLDDFPQYLFMI